MQKYQVTVFDDGSVSVVDDTAKQTVMSSYRNPAEGQTDAAYADEQFFLATGALMQREMERRSHG